MPLQTPLALARLAAEHMQERGIENARLEAELLLAAALGVNRLDLYLQHDRPLAPDEIEPFRAMVRRRLKREPLQYILGEAHFRELVLRVDPRVLIPRPETELLVGEVLAWAGAHAGGGRAALAAGHAGRNAGAGAGAGAADAATGPTLTALDIGTGSGAIALSLAREGPFAMVVATDISTDALAVAAENAERNGVRDRLELRAGALWEPCRDGERFDVVVSNPPYIAESERSALAPEVRDWEPDTALFAAADGLDVLERLVASAAARLRPGGLLALEVGAGQADAVADRIATTGEYAPPRVVRDLTGHSRIVLATSKSLAQ